MISNLTIMDPPNGSNFSNVNQTEEGIFLIYPEFFNMFLLTIVIGEMYYGIEIEHPIFKILFCNLCVTLIFSLVNVCFFSFNKILKFSLVMNGLNFFCLIFHFSSWCILSILRYIYVIHNDWLYRKFSKTSTIGNLALAAIFLTYSVGMSINLTAYILSGWPRKKMSEAPTSVFILRGITHIVTVVLLIGISCFFYAKILIERKRSDSQIVATGSQMKRNANQLDNVNLNTSEFGDNSIGEYSNSILQNHWKSYLSSITKKKPINKVDVFVMEVSF